MELHRPFNESCPDQGHEQGLTKEKSMSEELSAMDTCNVVGFFKEHFTPVDDVPENVERRDAVCKEARASLLIEANCTSERFSAFMKCGRYTDSGWIYPLSPKFIAEFDHVFYPRDLASQLTWTFDEFQIGNNQIAIDENGAIINRWKLFISKDKQSGQISIAKILPRVVNILDINKEFGEDLKLLQRSFYKKTKCLYHLCLNVSPYKRPEQVCRFFGNSSDPFSKFKLSGMWPDRFFESETLDKDECIELNCTEEQQVQSYLGRLTPCSEVSEKRSTLPSKYYDEWFCQTFPFRDQYGEIRMQLIKLYDSDTQSKLLIPVTSWMRGNFPYNQLFCVPVPEDRQPLYNLDLLFNPETQIIILTDSVELADSNQRHAPPGFVFTSFIGSPGRYDQVDWSPLRERKVYYLITNHSGICLEVATLKAREVKDYFDEQEPEVELAFIKVPVDYHTRKRSSTTGKQDFASVNDILKRRREQPPAVRADVVRLLESEEDFRNFCQDAEAEVNDHPHAWWEKESSSGEELRLVEQVSRAPKAIDYVMRPFLIRGEVTMLYAQKSVGKSSLAYSIAARVVAANESERPVPLLLEKWWTVPKKGHKVLYLDFENQSQIERKRELFQNAYFPKEKLAECRANLIVKDLSLSSKDFSDPGNHQNILDMIEAAKKEGTIGSPVDLLVIDTYTAFIQTETPATPANFKNLLSKIRSMGIAIMIVHHANSENDVRGLRSKLDQLACKFKLYRDDNQPGDLEEQPIWLKYEEWRGEMSTKLRQPFQIQYRNDDNRWHVVNPARDENAELKLIVDDFKRSKYNRDAICAMIGLEKSALSERLAKANK